MMIYNNNSNSYHDASFYAQNFINIIIDSPKQCCKVGIITPILQMQNKIEAWRH